MSLTEMSDRFFPAVRFKGHKLSDRQLAILELLGRGATNGEISERLFISKRTVESHLHKLRALITEALGEKGKISDRRLVLFAKDLLDGFETYKTLINKEKELTSFQAQKCQVV